jgi:hypothetical protein
LGKIKGVTNMSKRLNLGEIDRLVNELELEATTQNRRGNEQRSRSRRRQTSILRKSECTKRVEELEITAIQRKQTEERKKAKISRIETAKREKADDMILNLIGNYLKD